MIRGELMKMNEYIDHTLLKPEATLEQVIRLCSEAMRHSFKAVCVNPVFARSAAKELHGSGVLPCVVIGFPLGASAARVKSFEAERAVEDGAREMDLPDRTYDPQVVCERTELQAQVQRALSRLPDKLRTTILLYDMEGLSYEEIAEVLEIPVGTVKSRLFNARMQLRNWLKAYVEA